MASVAIMEAVKAHREANWTRCPVYDTEPTQPPADGSPFLVEQYPVGNERPASMGSPGSNVYRTRGTIRFVLHFPRRSKAEQWVAWIDELRALFRGKDLGALRTYGASPPSLDDRDVNGNYWRLSAVVEYDADVFG